VNRVVYSRVPSARVWNQRSGSSKSWEMAL
jgi:hypothetical protein